MHLVVDGFNVTMADAATRRLSRDEQVAALVRRIATRDAARLGASRVTVVFDGDRPEGVSGRRVELRFARGETADDVIVSIAAASEEPLLVVTSDRELRERVLDAASAPVEFRGCSSMFEAAVARRSSRAKRERMPGSSVGLPEGANRITEELKKIWLEED